MSEASEEYSAQGALAEIHRLLRDSDYFETVHEAENPGAVVNTFARFLRLAQIDRDEVRRLTEEKRRDANAFTLLTKMMGNIQAFAGLTATTTTVGEMEEAWAEFYEAAFIKRKAHAELADFLNDIFLDVERLMTGIPFNRITPDTTARRNAWTSFYSYVAKTFTDLRTLRTEHELVKAEHAKADERIKELQNQVAYQMECKAQAQGNAETLRDTLKMVIEVSADKIAEAARRR